MVATLQLIPITREECRSRFQKAGIPFDESSTTTTATPTPSANANSSGSAPLSSSALPSCKKNANDTNNIEQYTTNLLRPITLKLCHQSNDIIDVDDLDDEDYESSIHAQVQVIGVTTYSKQYEDGSVAAIVSLGRNHSTGIRLPLVSRALCDVSLTASSRVGGGGGGVREVAMVDLAGVDSPAVGKAALPAAASSAAAAAKKSFVGGQNESSSQSKLPSSSSSSQQSSNNDNKKEQQQTAAPPAAAAFLSMRKPSGANKHAVHIDGKLVEKPLGREIPLKHGSIISLYGPVRFAYEVSITNTDTITGTGEGSSKCKGSSSLSPKKRKANFNNNSQQQQLNSSPSPAKQKQQPPQSPIKPSPHQELRKRAHSLLVGECTCAMCMDILIKSTFAYPCGHAFCTKCSDEVTTAAQSTTASTTYAWNTITTIGRTTRTTTAKQTKGTCPTCRGDVQGWMPARSFDTVVWATALQGCFERDDAEYYLERRVEAKEGVVTVEERDCVLNNVHHHHHGNGGGGGGNANNQHDGTTTHGTNGLPQQQLQQQQRMNGCYLPPDPSLLKKETPMIRTLPPLFSNNAAAAFPTNHRLPPQQKKKASEDNEVICID